MNNEPFKKFMEICQENYPLITFLFGKFIDFDEKFCFNIQGGLTYSKCAIIRAYRKNKGYIAQLRYSLCDEKKSRTNGKEDELWITHICFI